MSNPVLKSKTNPADCLNCATLATCLLGKLSRLDLKTLQPLVRKGSFRRDEVLSVEAEVASSIKIVKIGMVFGYRLGRDGRMRPIGIAGRGAVFGLFSFLGQPNQATGIAASTGRVCEIPVAELKMQTAGIPLFGEHLLAAIMQSVSRIASWSEGMRVRGVVNQLAYAVLLLGEAQGNAVVGLPSHTALAELLGTSRETIVRALTTLESEGAIRRLEPKTYQLFEGPLLARLERSRF